MAERRHCGAIPEAILSGIPTAAAQSVSTCPASVPNLFGDSHPLQFRQLPLVREDIPDNISLTQSVPPPGPDVIPNMASKPLLKGVVRVCQAQGEYLFGGIGTSIKQEDRFDRM